MRTTSVWCSGMPKQREHRRRHCPRQPRRGNRRGRRRSHMQALNPRPPVTRRWQFLIFPALLLLNFVLIQQFAPGQAQRVEVSYTFFKQQVEADNVAEISTRADTVQGTFKRAVTYQPNPSV